jgi:hypothetical protein
MNRPSFSLKAFFIFAAASAVACNPSWGGTSAPELTSQALGIGALFKAHVSALEAIQSGAAPAPSSAWHLAAMSAGFGFSPDGIFGAITATGTVSVSATWENKAETSAVSRSNPRAVVLSASMNETDFEQQLEPAIRLALTSGAVKDEAALRSNLHAKARVFFQLAQALSAVNSGTEWDVSGLQLQLSFNASGDVIPLVQVGGTASLTLLWQKPSGLENVSSNNSTLSHNLSQLSKAISAEIPLAVAESNALSASGFELNQLLVGIILTASEDVAIGQAGGSLSGELKFARRKGAPHAQVQTSNDQFSSGLKEAIDLSSTLAKLGAAQDTKNWKLTSVSTTFSASASGKLTFVTTGAKGQIGLSFKRTRVE